MDQPTARKRAHAPPPNFGPCLLWPNGWMDEDATWYGSRPRPMPHYTRRGPSSRERDTVAPLLSAHVYCGHGRPSQLLLSSCTNGHPKIHTYRLRLAHKQHLLRIVTSSANFCSLAAGMETVSYCRRRNIWKLNIFRIFEDRVYTVDADAMKPSTCKR